MKYFLAQRDRTYICLILLLSVFKCYAATPTLQLSDLPDALVLNTYLEYVEDPQAAYSLENIVLNTDSLPWKRNEMSKLLGRDYNIKYWFRVRIIWRGGEASEAVVHIANHPGLLNNFGLTSTVVHSDNTPKPETKQLASYAAKDFVAPHYGFPIVLQPGEEILIVGWIHNAQVAMPALLPINLLTVREYDRASYRVSLILIIFYTVMGALLLFNALLFASSRQAVYGLYLLFLSAAIFGCSTVDGVWLRWLWPDKQLAEMNTYLANANALVMGMAYMSFVYRIMDIGMHHPYLRKIYRLLMLLGLGAFILYLLPLSADVYSMVAQGYAGVVLPFCLVFIVTAVYKKQPGGMYLLFAEILTMTGTSSFMLMMHGTLSINPVTFWGMHWAFSGEAILLSLALAAKTRYAKVYAEAENKAKSQFFAGLSHEFRTPLTVILGYSDAAMGRSVSLEEKENYLSIIHRSGTYLLQLVNDILDISKMEAQKFNVNQDVVFIEPLLRDIDDYVSILAKKKNIQFNLIKHYPLPDRLISDAMRIKQILINLSGNAIKFTAQGSVNLVVRSDAQHHHLYFEIQDTGIGMNADQVKNLFNAFAQANTTITHHYGGTGLGLYVSKQLANRIGGDITVESREGSGSQFTLTLPIDEKNGAEWNAITAEKETSFSVAQVLVTSESFDADLSSTHHESNGKTVEERVAVRKILVADDNSDIRDLITLHLLKWGAEVKQVEDGVEVLQAAQSDAYDIIFIDMEMPLMDGLTAVKLLRAKGYEGTIYSLTANDADYYVELSRVAGCNGHLTKPVNIDTLREVVNKID